MPQTVTHDHNSDVVPNGHWGSACVATTKIVLFLFMPLIAFWRFRIAKRVADLSTGWFHLRVEAIWCPSMCNEVMLPTSNLLILEIRSSYSFPVCIWLIKSVSNVRGSSQLCMPNIPARKSMLCWAKHSCRNRHFRDVHIINGLITHRLPTQSYWNLPCILAMCSCMLW